MERENLLYQLTTPNKKGITKKGKVTLQKNKRLPESNATGDDSEGDDQTYVPDMAQNEYEDSEQYETDEGPTASSSQVKEQQKSQKRASKTLSKCRWKAKKPASKLPGVTQRPIWQANEIEAAIHATGEKRNNVRSSHKGPGGSKAKRDTRWEYVACKFLWSL